MKRKEKEEEVGKLPSKRTHRSSQLEPLGGINPYPLPSRAELIQLGTADQAGSYWKKWRQLADTLGTTDLLVLLGCSPFNKARDLFHQLADTQHKASSSSVPRYREDYGPIYQAAGHAFEERAVQELVKSLLQSECHWPDGQPGGCLAYMRPGTFFNHNQGRHYQHASADALLTGSACLHFKVGPNILKIPAEQIVVEIKTHCSRDYRVSCTHANMCQIQQTMEVCRSQPPDLFPDLNLPNRNWTLLLHVTLATQLISASEMHLNPEGTNLYYLFLVPYDNSWTEWKENRLSQLGAFTQQTGWKRAIATSPLLEQTEPGGRNISYLIKQWAVNVSGPTKFKLVEDELLPLKKS